jgi:hypothetical protein
MGVFTTSKRRRLLDEESRRRPQQPAHPHGGGGEELQDADDEPPDLISRLPDDLLRDVLKLLPTTDGGRTQVLSRRWRPLWRSSAAPLNLEVRVSSFSDQRRVDGALAANTGPAHRLSLTWNTYSDGFPVIDGWLRSPTLDGLRDLEIRYHGPDTRYARAGCSHTPLPLPVLRFSTTLRVLCVFCDWCRIDIVVPAAEPAAGAGEQHLIFPHLEQLTLKGVNIDENTLHGILAGSPVLQSLMLHYNIGYSRLRIRSSTLRSLGMTDGHKDREGRVEEVVVEDAPALERIIPDGLMYHLKISVLNAPKLKILGYLYNHDASPKDLQTRVFKVAADTYKLQPRHFHILFM